jgi:hypothetical protein
VHSLLHVREGPGAQLALEQVGDHLALTVLAVSPTHALAAYAQLFADTTRRFINPRARFFDVFLRS